MPVHVEEMTTDLTVLDGESPLTEEQLQRLVDRVVARLEERRREADHLREETTIRRRAVPVDPFAE